MSLYYLPNARYADQAEQMRRLEASGTCLFCPGAGDDADDPEVELAATHWVVRRNAYPYRGARLHLLVVPRRHVSDLLDLPEGDLAEFWRVCADLKSRFDLTFYGLGVRCGDCRYTGGTIEHVHVHLVVGDVEDPSHDGVRIKLSSRALPTDARPDQQ